MQIEKIDTNWCVAEEDFDIKTNLHWESIFALGTGYMTTRASIDEGFEDDGQSVEYDRLPANVSLEEIPPAKSKWGTYMPVLQAKHPFWRMGIVNLPYYLGLSVIADGEKLDLEKSHITNYRRWLNLKTATLHRTLTWRTEEGKEIELHFRRYMNPEEKFVCVQECAIKMVSGSVEFEIRSYIDNNVRTNGHEKFIDYSVEHDKNGVIYSDIMTNMDNRVITASLMMVDRISDIEITKEKRRINAVCHFRLDENAESNIRKISIIASDLYIKKEQLPAEAITILLKNMIIDSGRLYESHVDYWNKLWVYSDIQIDANDPDDYNSQLAIRTAIYHLLRAKARDEYRGLICPKGTTSEVYMGAVFWDMEIFIEPFYIYTDPEMAKTIHMFRYKNLPSARELTKKAGYGGVRYPWMSAANGTEVCPMWEYADQQVHVTADVVIGIWHYYRNSLDEDFLFDHGAEIIIETARYWVERAEKIPSREGYHIYGVMGPDEYTPLSNNNAYTNHAARFNLRLAQKVTELMKERAPIKFKRLKKKLHLTDQELRHFQEVGEGLTIPKDDKRDIIWQCDHFDTAFVEPDIDKIWEDKSEFFGKYYLQEKRYRSKTLKQADVVAMFAVFSEDFNQAEKRASFDYYWPFTIHDSSNSMCHHQMVLANIGRAQASYEAWLRSINIDFGKRPRSSNGIHCANVGGMWQEVVFGFCGLVSAINTDILTFRPCLPSEIHKISFKIQWKQQWVRVTVVKNEVIIENLSSQSLTFVINEKEYTVEANCGKKVGF